MAKKSKPKKCVHNHSSYCKHCSKVKCWIGRKDGHENGYLYSFLKENNYPVNKIIETLTKRVKEKYDMNSVNFINFYYTNGSLIQQIKL